MLSHSVRSWIEDTVGGRVTSVAVLPGATSSMLHAVEVEATASCAALSLGGSQMRTG
jgi:hypothetical protein